MPNHQSTQVDTRYLAPAPLSYEESSKLKREFSKSSNRLSLVYEALFVAQLKWPIKMGALDVIDDTIRQLDQAVRVLGQKEFDGFVSRKRIAAAATEPRATACTLKRARKSTKRQRK